jgi:rhamnogalacturonyl hydrolase YesR
MARVIGVLISMLVVCAAAAADPVVLGSRVADWQLANVGRPVPAQRPETYDPRGWVMGAFYVGLAEFANRSGELRFGQAILDAGRAQNWQLGPRPTHADDYVIGQTWIWAYGHILDEDTKARDPAMIAAVRTRFDAILSMNPHGSLDFVGRAPGMEAACQDRWCWSDALFMAPPAWFALSRATGDGRYAAYADKEYWATVGTLYSRDDHLFYRDTRFIGRKGDHGERIFWARGNGWVYAGLARIIDILPEDAPERPKYVALFRDMSAKLITLQKADGTWPASLLEPGEGTPPETSGTSFFTYGLAFGVANGLLPEPQYRAAARKGWAALERAVGPDGRLGWVQPIGAAPDSVTAADTQPFGVGAFLLAAAAISRMP